MYVIVCWDLGTEPSGLVPVYQFYSPAPMGVTTDNLEEEAGKKPLHWLCISSLELRQKTSQQLICILGPAHPHAHYLYSCKLCMWKGIGLWKHTQPSDLPSLQKADCNRPSTGRVTVSFIYWCTDQELNLLSRHGTGMWTLDTTYTCSHRRREITPHPEKALFFASSDF